MGKAHSTVLGYQTMTHPTDHVRPRFIPEIHCPGPLRIGRWFDALRGEAMCGSKWRLAIGSAAAILSLACGGASDGDAVGPGPGSDPQNTIPIANAGADQNVSATLRVELDGSGSSDPDGSSLT